MKVEFTFNNGRKRAMTGAQAKLMQRLGHGTYQTRDLRAAVPQTDLELLTLQQLHELAKSRGVKVHHRAGAEKVREALSAQ